LFWISNFQRSKKPLPLGKGSSLEAHPPFACGWYGKNTEIYLQWIIDGWIYLKEKYNGK